MPSQGPVWIRRATAEDAAGIAHVCLAAWQEAHADAVPKEYVAAMRERHHEQSWRKELEVQSTERAPWVALIDDRVVGFASGGLSRDDEAGPCDGEVYQVHVDPECWRLGIGSSLLRHVIRDLSAHGFERAHLWVVSACRPATIFMQRQAWTRDGTTRLDDCGGAQVEEIRYSHDIR
jgi:ribosomal protein S18 acetylase RimI-like enzyme